MTVGHSPRLPERAACVSSVPKTDISAVDERIVVEMGAGGGVAEWEKFPSRLRTARRRDQAVRPRRD